MILEEVRCELENPAYCWNFYSFLLFWTVFLFKISHNVDNHKDYCLAIYLLKFEVSNYSKLLLYLKFQNALFY